MPAPLWEDAKNYLLMQGAPISDFNLNNAMNELAANPSLRPSYGGGPTNDMVANMGGAGPVQASGDLGVLSPSTVNPIAQQDTFDDRRAVNALAVLRKSSVPGPMARNAPARDARAVRQEYAADKEANAPVPTRKPPPGAPGSEPDPPGGHQQPGQAVAGQPTNIPGSGSDDGMGLIAKILAGAGLAAGVGGAAMAMRGGATAGMRPRGAPGVGFQSYTGPGGGPGSGFVGSMSGGPVAPGGPTITPSAMQPSLAANPMTGTLPLGAGPGVTMPLPPPTVSAATHGDALLGGYGPVAQTSVVPSGPAQSIPPDVINQGGPDIAALLAAPRPQGPASGGRIRSPRPRTPPTPKKKPTTRTAKKRNSQ